MRYMVRFPNYKKCNVVWNGTRCKKCGTRMQQGTKAARVAGYGMCCLYCTDSMAIEGRVVEIETLPLYEETP